MDRSALLSRGVLLASPSSLLQLATVSDLANALQISFVGVRFVTHRRVALRAHSARSCVQARRAQLPVRENTCICIYV